MEKNFEIIKSLNYSNKWNVFILLNEREKHYKPKRFFGYFIEGIKLLNVTRNREKHLFKNMNAYGFNHEILTNFDDYKIDLYDDLNNWLIPVQFILQNGKFLHFASQGYEVQIFITLTEIQKFKIK
jgi:hypothetical protein